MPAKSKAKSPTVLTVAARPPHDAKYSHPLTPAPARNPNFPFQIFSTSAVGTDNKKISILELNFHSKAAAEAFKTIAELDLANDAKPYLVINKSKLIVRSIPLGEKHNELKASQIETKYKTALIAYQGVLAAVTKDNAYKACKPILDHISKLDPRQNQLKVSAVLTVVITYCENIKANKYVKFNLLHLNEDQETALRNDANLRQEFNKLADEKSQLSAPCLCIRFCL